jgi:phosphotransferase system  glucose/maltose/N-acetylglucosamine-specific IIC component
MPIDVRLPISGLFLAVGVLLVGYGVGFEGLGTMAGHLNGVWGSAMLLFGLVLGYYGLRAERRTRLSGQASAR